MFPVLTVPEGAAELPEQLGTKYKFWYRGADGRRYLFKEGRPSTGENWSEKIGAELCKLLRIPAAHYDLASFQGRSGVVTPTFVPDGGRLVFGNELLARIVKDYDQNQRYQARAYKLRTVLGVLGFEVVRPPIAFETTSHILNAQDVFVGYLMFDAWIANQDRHHENWGLILTRDRMVHLAPSYDHASSLGRNEQDPARQEMLTTKDRGRSIERYVERASSAFFPTAPDDQVGKLKPIGTLQAFEEAARLRPEAAREWLQRLASVEWRLVRDLFSRLPVDGISGVAATFSLRMLELNQARLLNLEVGGKS